MGMIIHGGRGKGPTKELGDGDGRPAKTSGSESANPRRLTRAVLYRINRLGQRDHFNLRDGNTLLQDPKGVALPNEAAALQHAKRLARGFNGFSGRST